MRHSLVLLAGSLVGHTVMLAVAGGACSKLCESSCCSFTEPANECSGCDESWTCAPGKNCYDVSSRPPLPPPIMTEHGVCESFCKSASCCGFSEPAKSCGGCSSDYNCRPGSECYAGTRTQKHVHSPESQKTPKRHAHTPNPAAAAASSSTPKKHSHVPGGARASVTPSTPKKHSHVPGGAPTAKRRHAHTPAGKNPKDLAAAPRGEEGVATSCADTTLALKAAHARIAELEHDVFALRAQVDALQGQGSSKTQGPGEGELMGGRESRPTRATVKAHGGIRHDA